MPGSSTRNQDPHVAEPAAIAADPFSASVRYFYQEGGALQRVAFPIFPPPEQGAGARVTGPEPLTYATNFRTPLGDPLSLTATPTSGFAFQYDPVDDAAYQVLRGAWTVGVVGATAQPESVDVLCGLSGIEWIRVAKGGALNFELGGPAYAPFFGGTGGVGTSALITRAPGVANDVTTTWIGALPPASSVDASPPLSYYTQAERAPFYGVDPNDPDYLTFAEVRAATLPASGPTFPLVPYGGAIPGPTGFDGIQRFEQQVLTSVRRNAILGDAPADGPQSWSSLHDDMLGGTGVLGPTAPLGPTGPTRSVVTPQGLLARFDTDSDAWRDLTLAQANQGAQTLVLTEIETELRVALLSSQLFLVVTDPTKFLSACSIHFLLDENAFNQLIGNGVVPAPVIASLRYLEGYPYDAEAYFNAVIEPAMGQDAYNQYGDDVRRAAAQAKLVVSGFVFDLSPLLWAKKNTILIFKYSDRPLTDLVADLTSWTAPEAFLVESPQATQQQLQAIIADAEARAATDSNFTYFAETVCGNRRMGGGDEIWTGLLCLNCTVPLTSLPPQLEGLAAGIDPSKFYAHHVGVSLSAISVSGGTLGIDDSSLFGLIHYDSPADLFYQGHPYAFKVLTLQVLFANSQITNFASQIELLVAALFGERSSLPGAVHGDNLVLNGVWQHRDGVDSYAFSDQAESVFQIASQVLDTVSVTDAQLVTIIPPKGTTQSVQTRFTMAGLLRWRALPAFDAFSFGGESSDDDQGGLQYGNLSIDMSFDPWTLNKQPPVFTFDASRIAFDLTQSEARASSLYSRFPLRVTGLVQADATVTPDSLGYMRTYSPLSSSSFPASWFALVLSLNLGSPGSLVASTGFYADLMLAWAPSADGYSVWIGIKLPGSTGSGAPSFTIEGPLQLRMAAITFIVTDADDPTKTAYLLKFSSIALRFLGVSFPPGGNVDAMLFGDPNPSAAATSLGWYAAYSKD